MSDFDVVLTPGAIVSHPDEKGWGNGQVQSNIAGKITVNFENRGKVVIDGTKIMLVLVALEK